jgi:alanine dehydrogenase
MIVGVPKEIKEQENRVAITPAGVRTLVGGGNTVLIQKSAGVGSGITDQMYKDAGARIVPTLDDVYKKSDMVMKVKEPLEREYKLFRPGLLLFTYLHLAADEKLTRELMKKNVTAIAYETIQLDSGLLPLLMPMSEVAGRMSVQLGAHFLEARHGGRGILLSGMAGVPPADVAIIGGGVVGYSAAKVAVGLGAQVIILDNNIQRLRELDEIMHGRVITIMSTPESIERIARFSDLVIGSVLVAGARAPKLLTTDMVKQMKPGAVIVDVAIDQGGCIETSRLTTHSNPTFVKHGVVHYCVGNMPGAVPRTSTLALTNSTLPYAQLLAEKGFEKAIAGNIPLARGVNVHNGKVAHPGVARAFGLKAEPICEWN